MFGIGGTRIVRALLVATMWVATVGSPLNAQDSEAPPFRMVYSEFYPYSFTDTDGQARGMAIDIARRLIEGAGRELEFIAAEDPGVMVETVASGEADMTSLLGFTANRMAMARATLPLGSFQIVLFARKNGPGRGLDHFHGMSVGVVTGSLSAKHATDIPDANIVEYSNADALIMGLLTGEVDATVSAADGFNKRLRQMGSDIFVEAIAPPLGETPYGLFASPSSGNLMSLLNAQIEAQLTPEVLSEIQQTWFGEPTRLPEHELIFWGSIAGIVILVIAIGATVNSRRQSRRACNLSNENAEIRLLTDALDGINAAIVIFDKNMRAVHWNKGFARTLPTMVDSLSKGAHLRTLIASSYVNGTIDKGMAPAEAKSFADGIVRRLANGETQNRIVHTRDGRVFDATDFAVGGDQFASVRVDVTKLHKQADMIRKQKIELEAANERLSMFATIAAHDLKAPLVQQARLVGFIEEDIADIGFDLPDEILEHFSMLRDLSGKMKLLIRDLLDHSRSAANPEQFEDVDLNGRLPDILDLAGLPDEFRVKIEGEIPMVRVDPVAFDTIVRNLISNAAKHHDRNEGMVKIRGHEADGIVVIEFEDDGPGIPERYRQAIFEPFKRLSANIEGTGLGLSFINKTLQQWGGSIHVNCPNERGSVFVLSIPNVTFDKAIAAE